MTPDSILTLAGLAIAVYSLLDRGGRLRFRLRWRRLDWIVLIAALLVLQYLILFPLFATVGLTPQLRLHRYGLTPSYAAYIVAVTTALLLGFRLAHHRISRTQIFRLRELVEEASRTGLVSELVPLLERNFEELARIYRSDFLFSGMAERIKPPPTYAVLFAPIEPTKHPPRDKKRFIRPVLGWIHRILPKYEKEQRAAHDVVRMTLLDSRFVEAVARTRPSFGILATRENFVEREEFLQLYFRSLLFDGTSALRRELRDRDDRGKGNIVPPAELCPLIHHFFVDTAQARRLSIYRPIGHIILDHLSELGAEERDPYNEPARKDNLRELGQSPIAVGIQLFDILVTSGIRSGTRSHLWLYFLEYFCRDILRNYAPRKTTSHDPEGSPPIMYARLLEMIFESVIGWATALKDLPAGYASADSIDLQPDDCSIPKHALIALGVCVREVATAPAMEDEFREPLIHRAFDTYFRLWEIDPSGTHAKIAALTLEKGGSPAPNPDVGVKYRRALCAAFSTYDKIRHQVGGVGHVEDLAAALECRDGSPYLPT